MRILRCIALLAATLTPAVGMSQFSYTAVELSLIDIELDAPSVDGDGFDIAGSFEINDQFFAFGAYQDQSLDFGIDGSALSLGAGYHDSINEQLDFVATASLVSAEVEAFGFSGDDDGFGIAGGIRAALNQDFQVDAMLNWVDLDDSGSDTFISVTGRYYFNESIAALLQTSFGDDDADVFRIGVRFEF